MNDLKNESQIKMTPPLIQCGISEVRSIAINQRLLKINALNTPGPNPKRSIVVGINKGKAIAPTKGVKATIKRSIN